MRLGWRLAHLPLLLAVTAGLLAGAAGVGWLVGGGTAAAGAAGGAGLVAAGYLGSNLAVAWADAARPGLLLAVALGSYVAKVSLVSAVLLAVAARDGPGLVPMAYGVLAGAVAWPATMAWWVVGRPRLAERRSGPQFPAGGDQ
ncbi:MAG: hypothetical protein GEV12_15200 [Micromonosporaceae bacterium]|nr:hypothetical protein [Micromonosporaceae bacterium]